jgi:hypothetical protein
VTGATGLTVRETMTLDFERRRFKHPGLKDATIIHTFSESPVTYHARLLRLLDDPRAELYDAQLVRRLRRLRDARRAARGRVA